MAAEMLIRVEGFYKTYRETAAVTDLTFEVNAGQILAILGPNGAGKTTTLRAMSGIIPPTQGKLFIAGHDVVRDSETAKRELALVPDDPKLFDSLTVLEHLEFVATVYRVSDFEAKAAQLLEQFEMTEKRDTVAQELSRGMRQKVAICCALLHDPRVILFDEPLTGLDPRGIRTLKDSIVKIAGTGAAIVVSSHLLALIEDLCTHLLILHRGRRLFCGGLQEARGAFADLHGDASLEEVFFRATEGKPVSVEEAVNP